MLFSWKRRRTDPPSTLARINPMPASGNDWSAFENAGSWPSIKVWLTVETVWRLDDLAAYRDQSRSEVIRDLLFIGLYGHYAYAQLMSERRGLPRAPGELESGERMLFSRKRGPQAAAPAPAPPPPPPPAPSANRRENLRLFLPEPMKVALETVAGRDGGTVSATVRRMVETLLLGATPLPAAMPPQGATR